MPKNADRIDNIKSYIRQEMLTTHPSFRDKAENMRELQRIGYNADPAKENLPKVDALTFDDIVKFYEENIKGKPYCIGVMGNPKDIDLKKLEKYGKVVKLNERKLFNTKRRIVLKSYELQATSCCAERATSCCAVTLKELQVTSCCAMMLKSTRSL